MAKRKRRPTKREESVKAWEKETKRIIRWANKLAREGFIVDLSAVNLETPSRITQKRLNELKKVRGRNLYNVFGVHAGAWEYPSQGYSYAKSDITIGQQLTQTQIRKIRADVRAYKAQYGAVEHVTPDAWETAYQNAVSAVSASRTPEGTRVYQFLTSHEDDRALKRKIFELGDDMVRELWETGFDSNAANRETSYNWIMSELLGRPLTAEEAIDYSLQV